MDTALVYKWDGPVPGREAAALQLKEDVDSFWDKAVANGQATDYAWYIGGLEFSLFIVRGQQEGLLALAATPELQLLNMRASLVNQNMQMAYFQTGDSVEPMLAVWGSAAEQLA